MNISQIKRDGARRALMDELTAARAILRDGLSVWPKSLIEADISELENELAMMDKLETKEGE